MAATNDLQEGKEKNKRRGEELEGRRLFKEEFGVVYLEGI